MFKRILVITSMLTVSTVAVSAKPLYSWDEGVSLPKPTQEIYPALHNNAIVVAGGINAAQVDWEIHSSVWQWEIGQTEWSELPALPEPWHHGILVSWQGKLLHVGGFTRSDQGSWINRNDVLELKGDTWIKHSELPLPLSESNVAVLNGQLHIAGGRSPGKSGNAKWADQIDVSSHWYFDTEQQAWTPAAALPNKRNSACSVVVDGQWYIIGGRTVSGGNVANNERYNSDSDAWTALAPMPQAQAGLACASLHGDIYVFGGEFFSGEGGVYKEVWHYSVKTDTWKQAGEMPVPRHGLGAVTYQGRIAVVAGASKVGGNDTQSRVSWFSVNL